MNKEDSYKIKDVCAMIAKDAADDATNFDGKPFNGKTVAEYFGNHGASIASLAKMIALIVHDIEEKNNASN